MVQVQTPSLPIVAALAHHAPSDASPHHLPPRASRHRRFQFTRPVNVKITKPLPWLKNHATSLHLVDCNRLTSGDVHRSDTSQLVDDCMWDGTVSWAPNINTDTLLKVKKSQNLPTLSIRNKIWQNLIIKIVHSLIQLFDVYMKSWVEIILNSILRQITRILMKVSFKIGSFIYLLTRNKVFFHHPYSSLPDEQESNLNFTW